MNKKTSNMPLRRLHAHGKHANRIGARRKSREKATWGTLEMLGAESLSEKNRLMEARKFAQLCDDEELDYFCGFGQANGWRLTHTHILQLLRVAVRQQRMRLAAKCAKYAWSTRALQNEIDRLGLHRPYGGRKQKPPQSVDEALRVTERMAARWKRWVSVLKEDKNNASKKRITLDKLPKPIRAELDAMSQSAEKLYEEIEKKLAGRSSKPRKRFSRRTG